MSNLHEDHILDFIDGRLATGDEEELLHTLAVSPERRQVLHEHLRLREITTTLSSHERFSVPDHVTSQLFATLGTMGFAAPASTEAILTRAPQFVNRPEVVNTVAMIGSGWKLGFTSLVTASVMSFLLGVGAIYVFGTRLGIHTLSQQKQLAAMHHVSRPMANVTHSEFNLAAVDMGTTLESAAPHDAATIASIPVREDADLGSVAGVNPSDDIRDVPVTYTAPRERSLTIAASIPRPGLAPIIPDWGMAIPSPFLNEQGIISFRYGSGPALNGGGGSWTSPNSPSAQWTSFSELKFTWHLWKYVTARAAMGELSSYERMPNTPPVNVGANKYEITTSLTKQTSTLIGGELGFTLDPLGIPLEVSGGLMTDGSGQVVYTRGGIFAHFEPSGALSISAGIEGIQYQHNIQTDYQNNKAAYQNYMDRMSQPSFGTETAGFIGPSLEIGWHF